MSTPSPATTGAGGHTALRLFSCRIQDNSIDRAVDMRGFSHAGQPIKTRVLWYPWEEDFRQIFFFARHRRDAAKQLDRANLLPRDLDEGRKCDNLIADHHRRVFARAEGGQP